MEGTPFGRYQLLDLLGRGGMGEVWRAFDTGTDRVVAVKVLLPELASDPVFEARFRREAKAVAGLNEPHVIPIHDFGEIDGRLYVDMRLIEGHDLHDILAAGPLSANRAVFIIEQVGLALEAAHRIGLVHRDVKPSNIRITENDFAYLIDFGIAQGAGTGLTSAGMTVGTWAYMAPERLGSGHIDSRSDVYSLACVLHECVTGQRPFPGKSMEQLVPAHMWAPPPIPSTLRPGLPPGLDEVVANGMAKDPAERYSSTTELARAARAALTGRVSQNADSTSPPPAEWTVSGLVSDSDTATDIVTLPPHEARFEHGAQAPEAGSHAASALRGLLTDSAPSISATAHDGRRGRRRLAISAVLTAVVFAAVTTVVVMNPWADPNPTRTEGVPNALATLSIPQCGGVSDETLAKRTEIRGLVGEITSVGCQWLVNNDVVGPQFSISWYRGTSFSNEREVEEASRASVEDIAVEGQQGWIAVGTDPDLGNVICEIGIEVPSMNYFFEWSVTFTAKPFPDPCLIAKDFAAQSVKAIGVVPVGVAAVSSDDANSPYFPNLEKDCEVLGADVVARPISALNSDITNTFTGNVCRWHATTPAGAVNITNFWFEKGHFDAERRIAQGLGYMIEDRTISDRQSMVLRPVNGGTACGVVTDVGGVVGWWVTAPAGVDACGPAVAMMETTLTT